LVLPEELIQKMEEEPELKKKFHRLTAGKRVYNLYFSSSKQSKTKLARIEKYTK
tara:strand:+ start:303 stop:464 length:162 start_codon:yes stop_codon:yes gene_type:complete